MLSADFGVTIRPEEFEERFATLHKQLFASTEFEFNEVTTHVFTPPKGRYQVDHSFIHDGANWHMFYVTGDMSQTDEFLRCYRKGDWAGAAKYDLEPGNGHAVGKDLFSLKFRGNAFFESQGDFDMITRACCSVFNYKNTYGMLYDVRGANYTGMSLAWSDDLEKWELDEGNPFLSAPQWAAPGSTCKDPHVLYKDGIYLIYYVVKDRENYCGVALATTTDWKTFCDEGCVFRSAPMLRGTLGIESPAVVLREGLWHLFVTYGPGLWHAVSRTPSDFVASRGGEWNVGTGFYFMGHFHATEIIEDENGRWWMTTDRKEQKRMLNRKAGKLCYRGSYEDDKILEEGLYLSGLSWKGDQPVLEKPH